MVGLPPLTHDRSRRFDFPDHTLLTVWITVPFYTYPEINLSNTQLLDEGAVPYDSDRTNRCSQGPAGR